MTARLTAMAIAARVAIGAIAATAAVARGAEVTWLQAVGRAGRLQSVSERVPRSVPAFQGPPGQFGVSPV